MDNFKQKLIEEFGQGIVDHISRNRGKYALGAGAGALAGYGAYKGNLSSAINMGINSAAFGVGTHQNEVGYDPLPIISSAQIANDLAGAAYNLPIDPQIPLIPGKFYDAAKLYNPDTTLVESTEINNEEDDDDKPSATTEVGTFIAGSGAVLAGVANADKIKDASIKIADKVKDTTKEAATKVVDSVKEAATKVKDKVQDATKEKVAKSSDKLSKVLSNVSKKAKESSTNYKKYNM